MGLHDGHNFFARQHLSQFFFFNIPSLLLTPPSLHVLVALRALLGDLQQVLLEVKFRAVDIGSGIVCCCRDWGVLLCVLGLGLVYQLLLLLVLVLRVLSSLCGGDGALVGEAVEHAKGEGGPPEDVDSC